MKLNEIQKKLIAPKSQFNKFGNYKYRSCEDILESVKKLLTDGWITITDEIVLIGNRYYVKATASYHTENNQTVSTTAYAREPEVKKGMDESQITGAASSYARKYALNGLFCIDDTKDADTTQGQPEGQAEDKKPDKDQLVLIDSLANKLSQAYGGLEISTDKLIEACKTSFKKYPKSEEDVDKLVNWFTNNPGKVDKVAK